MQPRWISEADVVHLMDLGEAVHAVERGLEEEAAKSARNMDKTAAHWGASSNMHAIGAVFEAAGLFGTKTWGHTPRGSTPMLLLWDAESGKLRAIIEAMALGQMRTGAMSGVGTRHMSDPSADDLAIIGSGKQAITQVAAVAIVRKLRRIRVYSPTESKRQAFAERLTREFPDVNVVVASSVEDATAGAPIITLVTRAQKPFLEAAMIERGAHVNAAGAITRERCEFAQDVFSRAQLVAADSVSAVQRHSSEFIDWYQERLGGDWSPVRPVCELVASGRGRGQLVDISLFKPMGMGISDLSLGTEILRRAEESGVGHTFSHPQPVPPRLFGALTKEAVT